MAIFWNTVANATQSSFTDTEFFSTTDTTAITRAEISKTIMKKSFAESQFRKYVSKITDFGANKSSYFIIPKKMTRDDTVLWTKEIGEFDPLPSLSMNYKQFDVSVDERGAQFPFTERVKIFSNYDVEAEIKEQAGNSIIASVERDLLLNAFAYLDLLGIVDSANSGKPYIAVGKTLAPTKTFSSNTTAITVTQVTYDTTAHTIEGKTVGNMTMNDVLAFAKALADNYTPSYSGSGFGDYLVICNKQAVNRLMQDQTFFTAITRFQDKEKLYSGYLGSFYGQEFVEDKGKLIDRLLCTINPELSGKAICIFLGKDAIKEAIVKPEQVLPLQKADFGRFMSYAIQTYRGETPMWFASSEGQGSGGILVGA